MVLNGFSSYPGDNLSPILCILSVGILVAVVSLVFRRTKHKFNKLERSDVKCLINGHLSQYVAEKLTQTSSPPTIDLNTKENLANGGAVSVVSLPPETNNSPKNSKRHSNGSKSKRSRRYNKGSTASNHSKPLVERNEKLRTNVPSRNPLDGYWDLPMSSAELYKILFPYRLSLMERIQYGYPVASSTDPTQLVLYNHTQHYYSQQQQQHQQQQLQQEKENINEDDLNAKECLRCGRSFYVSSNGQYTSVEERCSYHCLRRDNHGRYACCDGSDDDEGCVRSSYHICSLPLPTSTEGFVRTRRRNADSSSISSFSSSQARAVYALDCEMCYTINGLEVTKVSVVGMDGCTVYDSYVKPASRILDYNTAFSGVTAKHLQGVSTTLVDAQAILLRLFSADTIVVGHGLENDLRALRILHDTIVDTAVVFPHWNGLPYRRSLRSLVRSYLRRDIQSEAHDSAEDARATMELMLWKALRDRSCLRISSSPHHLSPHHRTPSSTSCSSNS